MSRERIRILRVIARLNVGGPALHVSIASAGLDPARYETRLLAGTVSPEEGDMERVAHAKGVTVEKVRGLGRELSFFGDAAALWRVRKICGEFRPHVVHTHTAKAGGVGRVAAAVHGALGGRPRPKLVHTFHGHVLRGYFGRLKEGMFRRVERSLARRTDALVVPSERIAKELTDLRIAPREKFRVIPLGLELEPFLAVPPRIAGSTGVLRAALGIPGDAVLVGIVGRLTAIKSHTTFLQAAARLKRRTRNRMRFVLVGDGELRGALEEEARARGIADSVSFAGWRDDLPAVYADLDVVALSSNAEGTPITLIEAMASGRPVASTAPGGVPDVVEDGRTGLLVDPGRDDLLAVALGRLADEPDLRARLAAAAREDAARRFGAARLLADLDSLYGDLLR